jgi:hypothetical protein
MASVLQSRVYAAVIRAHATAVGKEAKSIEQAHDLLDRVDDDLDIAVARYFKRRQQQLAAMK